MHARLILFLSVLMPFFLTAQSNYKEAYARSSTGDTLRGFINYREWFRSPEKVLFKQHPEDPDVLYLTSDNTTWYAVLGYESYTSYTVSISMNELQFDRLSDEADTTTVTKAVFLKELVRGDRLNLYSYTDNIKERFYILDKRQSIPSELLYRKTLKNMEEHDEAVYRKQLLLLATEYDALTTELDRRIQTAAYTRDELKRIVEKMNNKLEPALTQATEKHRKATFFMGMGLNKSRVTYSGESLVTIDGIDDMGRNKYKQNITTEAYMPRFSAGMDHYLNPAVRRFAIRTEVAATPMKSTVHSYYKYNNYSDAGIEYTYTLSVLSVSVIPQLLYNFYNTPNFKWYAGAGAAFNFVYTGKNSLHRQDVNQARNDEETTENFFPIRKYAMNTVVHTGVLVKQRVNLSFIWGNPVEYTNYAAGTTASVRAGLLAFSVAYVF